MESFFHTLKQSLLKQSLTDSERARIRGVLAQRMAHKPAGHGFPIPLWFIVAGRRTAAGVLAITLVMGSTGGLTYASQDSLPTQALYPVKLATEEIVAFTKTSHEARATYEIKRVEKRFTEVAALAKEKTVVTPEVTEKLIAKIETHINRASKETESIKEDNLTLALDTNTQLATTIEAHRDALQAVVDAQPENNVSAAAVLAIANVELENTEAITEVTIAETVDASPSTDNLKEVVIARTNDVASRIAQLKNSIQAAEVVEDPALIPGPGVIENPEAPRQDPAVEAIVSDTGIELATQTRMGTTGKETASSIAVAMSLISSNEAEVIPVEVVPAPEQKPEPASLDPQQTFILKLETMLASAQTASDEGRFSDALIILQTINQELTLQTKLQAVETTFQVEVPSSIIDVKISEEPIGKPEIKEEVSATTTATTTPEAAVASEKKNDGENTDRSVLPANTIAAPILKLVPSESR